MVLKSFATVLKNFATALKNVATVQNILVQCRSKITALSDLTYEGKHMSQPAFLLGTLLFILSLVQFIKPHKHSCGDKSKNEFAQIIRVYLKLVWQQTSTLYHVSSKFIVDLISV